jgi:hypothetical protein
MTAREELLFFITSLNYQNNKWELDSLGDGKIQEYWELLTAILVWCEKE